MQNQIPKISIIIPVYNVESYITQTLKSCISQTLEDIEIIVVDDCGQDQSIQIAKDFALKDERIKIIRNTKNLGALQTRLEGIKIAKGEYILNLDGDDFLDIKTCEFAYGASRNGFADIVSFGAFELCGKDIKLLYKFKNAYFSKPELYKHFLYNFALRWNVWGKIIKAEKYKQVLSYLDNLESKVGMTEDVLQSFVLYAVCENFINIDNVLYFYRIHPQSASNNQELANIYKMIESHQIAIKEIIHLKETHPEKFSPILYKLFLIFLKRELFFKNYALKKQKKGQLDFKDKINKEVYRMQFKMKGFFASKLRIFIIGF